MKELIECDPNKSIRELSQDLERSQLTIRRHLHEIRNVKRKSNDIPHVLTYDQIKSRNWMSLNFYLILPIVQTWHLPNITFLGLWRISLEVGNLRMSWMSKLESKHLSTPSQRNGSAKDQTNWPNYEFIPQITMVYISNIDFMFC